MVFVTTSHRNSTRGAECRFSDHWWLDKQPEYLRDTVGKRMRRAHNVHVCGSLYCTIFLSLSLSVLRHRLPALADLSLAGRIHFEIFFVFLFIRRPMEMWNKKPLTSLALPRVLSYLGYSKRQELLILCPSLRLTEKQSPLRLRFLDFDLSSVSLDNVKFKVGVIRVYKNIEQTPEMVAAINECGGIDFDVDEYGARVSEAEERMMPGDILVGEQMGLNEVEDLINLAISPEEESQRSQRHGENDKLKVPPFTHYLQFTVSSVTGTKYIERMEYNRSLVEAKKYMMTAIFGGRKHPIEVDKFEVSPNYIYRMPTDLKIRARNLKIGYNNGGVLDAILPILDMDHPFETVDYWMYDDFSDFEHPIIQNAQTLILREVDREYDLESVSHNNVIVESTDVSFDQIINLFIDGTLNHRPIGTCFRFCGIYDYLIEDILNEALEQEGARAVEGNGLNGCHQNHTSSVVVPMNGVSQLKISRLGPCHHRCNWELELLVQPAMFRL